MNLHAGGDPKDWSESITTYDVGDRVCIVITRDQFEHEGEKHELLVSARIDKVSVKTLRVVTDDGFHSEWDDPVYAMTIVGGSQLALGKTARFSHAAVYRDELDFVRHTIGSDALTILSHIADAE